MIDVNDLFIFSLILTAFGLGYQLIENSRNRKKIEEDMEKEESKRDEILYELFEKKYSLTGGIDDEVYPAEVVEDVLINLESAIEEEISEQRFFIWPKEREKYLKQWAKFIPNPENGGDDDFIVFDSFRGEYTFGENGFTPLCSTKELNKYYYNKDLSYIIKQPRH